MKRLFEVSEETLVDVDSILVIHVVAVEELFRSNFPVIIYGNKNIPLNNYTIFCSITIVCIHIIKQVVIVIYSL